MSRSFGPPPSNGAWYGIGCGAWLLLAVTGCGSDPAPAMPTGDDPSAASTTEDDPDTTVGPTLPPSSATSSSSTDTSTDDADASSSGEPSAPLDVDVDVYTYPNQPMVVDLAFSAPDLTLSVEHPDDPGIRTGPTPGLDGQTWIRVRGLAPQSAHALQWSAVDPEGRHGDGEVLVQTDPALPGYVASFPVTGADAGFGGLLLFDLLQLSPRAPSSLFMVDAAGVTRWHIGRADEAAGPVAVFAGAKLRDDGTVLFLRGLQITILDEMGVEQLSITSEQLGVPGLHHDVIELPTGNLLALSYTFRDIEYPDLGLTHVAGDLIVEMTPEGDLVWEWDAFDHLDPQRRRDGFDDLIIDPQTLTGGRDWTHGNGLVYEPQTDSILFSMRHQDWLVRIDRATGDVRWRFGAEGDFALVDGTWPYHQHSPQWQDDGSLLLYDNGLGNPDRPDPEETSRAVRYVVDPEAMTVAQAWEDGANDFVSPIAGDADRLPDGGILVTDSSIGLDQGPAEIYARVRQLDEASPAPRWSLTTALGTFIYRCTASPLLPGETP